MDTSVVSGLPLKFFPRHWLRYFFPLSLACLSCACATTDQAKATHRTDPLAASAVAFSPDGRNFVAANYLRIWVFSTQAQKETAVIMAAQSSRLPIELDQRYGWGNSLVFIADCCVATTGMGADITVWNIHSKERVASYSLGLASDYPVSLAYFAGTGTLAVGTMKGRVSLIQTGEAESVITLPGSTGIVHDLQFSADGRYLGSVGTSNELLIWDLASRSEMARLPTPQDTMEIERMAEPGQFLVAGQQLEVWKYVAQPEVQELGKSGTAGQSVAWFSTSLLLAAATFNPFLIGGGNEAAVCRRAVAISPDGKLLADVQPGSFKEKIRIIDTQNGAVLKSLNPSGDYTCDLAFSPDGSRLVLANVRGVSLYDTNSWDGSWIKMSLPGPEQAQFQVTDTPASPPPATQRQP